MQPAPSKSAPTDRGQGSGDKPGRNTSFYGKRPEASGTFSKGGKRSASGEGSVIKEGYLNIKSTGRFKKWQTQYFELSGHYLKYYKVRVRRCTRAYCYDMVVVWARFFLTHFGWACASRAASPLPMA